MLNKHEPCFFLQHGLRYAVIVVRWQLDKQGVLILGECDCSHSNRCAPDNQSSRIFHTVRIIFFSCTYYERAFSPFFSSTIVRHRKRTFFNYVVKSLSSLWQYVGGEARGEVIIIAQSSNEQPAKSALRLVGKSLWKSGFSCLASSGTSES